MIFASKSVVRLALLAGGLSFLSFSTFGLAADPKAPTIPDADYAKLVESETKMLDEALKDKDKKAPTRARIIAIVLAAAAQDNLAGKDAQQRATVRDAALKIADLIKDKKMDEAAKIVADLPTMKPDAKAKTEKVKIMGDKVDVQELMSQFQPTKGGGLGYEKTLIDLASSKGKKVDDKTPTLAYHVGIIGALSKEYVADKTPKKWEEFAEAMRSSAEELADAAGKKDAKATLTAVNKVTTSCSQCHDIYRKQ
jgi:hypothetical protein